MPIKNLDAYLADRKHLSTLPLSTLSDTRLGIDAATYFNLLLETPPTREPLLAATGGPPLALTTKIEADLRSLEKLRIKPVFVFPGLLPNKRVRHHYPHEHMELCNIRREAWAKYESQQEEQATALFESRGCVHHWDLWRTVLRIFRHRNVEFIVAPYLAWAQLLYLQKHQKSYIHAIYGPSELLLYPGGVDKLITSLDFTSPTPSFNYVIKQRVLSDLGLSEDQFLDIGILAGFENSPTFPPIQQEQHLIKSVTEMVKYYKTGYAAVNAFGELPAVKQSQYLEHYARTRTMIKFSLILSSEGTVTPFPLALPPTTTGPHHSHTTTHHITAADVPGDIHEVFTHRLPDEIFFYLSRGLIGPHALVWLTSGQIIENPPLDNGETTEYRRFVKEVITEGSTGPRATALALINSVTNSYWSNRRITGSFWFEPSGPPNQRVINHNGPQTSALAERVTGWHVTYALIEEELRRQNSSTIDFALCLGATSTDKLATRTRNRSNVPVPTLEKKDEIVANVIWRFLELRGFLLSTHSHSALAHAMHLALKQARVNDKLQDPLYLFLELVRAGVLHGNLWSGRAYSGGPSFGTDQEKKCMLLVMRVLSILPLNFKPQPWQAPLSRELLVFNSFLRSLTRALRTLLEVTSLNLLLRGDARKGRDDFLDVALSLPFQGDVNTGFGVLAKVYLDALTHLNGGVRVTDPNAEGVREAKDTALEICEDTFPGVKYPKMEVERGFRFWDVALLAIKTLHKENSVLPELAEQFEAAEAWLAPMRP